MAEQDLRLIIFLAEDQVLDSWYPTTDDEMKHAFLRKYAEDHNWEYESMYFFTAFVAVLVKVKEQ